MATQLLTTKFYIPTLRPDHVPRPHLIEKLNKTSHYRITLISAPAGYGKSTLISEWCSQSEKPVCWLSLDERDNDPHRFLNYILTALQQLGEDIGESTLLRLQSAEIGEVEDVLIGLINELTLISQPFVLILDDYHVITEPKVNEIMLFLLDHKPQQMHLLISSRADPTWPISRLRARCELLEIRSQDLRFTLEEAATFLKDCMGLVISKGDIAALERRTEGWIAGLQLAALSMQHRQDKEGFIRAFTGSNRYVMDYLVEEVLDQQTPEIRTFLLYTSILERLTSSLCDAVVDRQNSYTILTDLVQRNLFLIPLDDERRWYRYHHLFADLLKNHLQQTLTDQVLDLHRRASIWYEENGLLPDAINHALTANEVERIAQLTEEMAVYKMDYGELKALLAWLDRLPESTKERFPWLMVTRAWTLFNLGKYDAAEEKLTEIEKILSHQILTDKLTNRIKGHVAAIQSNISEYREDPYDAIQKAEYALELLPAKDVKLRAFVAIRWANCLVWYGDFERAIPAYKEAGESSKLVGDGQLAIAALSEMASVQMTAGKLREAVRNIGEIKRYAEELAKKDGRRLPAMGILYRHMSSIKREQNELTDASYYAREAIAICRQWGEKESLLITLMALARVLFAQRDYRKLYQTLDEILKVAGQISQDYLTYSQTWVMHYRLLRGEIEESESYLNSLGLVVGEEFGYHQQHDYYFFAHLLIAKGSYSQALEVVDCLLKAVYQSSININAIRYIVLQAIILYQLNRIEEAMISMQEALSFARLEGYVRAILDEGEAVGDLLRTAAARGIEVEYADKLLRVLNAERESSTRTMFAAGLIDPLSEREMEVLRLLITELSTPEIADELFISVSTVRSHIKQIYSKLDVHSRFEAVRKAKELNLL